MVTQLLLFNPDDYPRLRPSPTPDTLPRLPRDIDDEPDDPYEWRDLFADLDGPDPEDVDRHRLAYRFARRSCLAAAGPSWAKFDSIRTAVYRKLCERKPRSEPRDYGCKFVRKVKGRKYQGRFPLPANRGGSINLGLWDTPQLAREAVRVWIKAGCSPVAGLPAGVLPKYVRLGDSGSFDAVVPRKGGERIVLQGFSTASEAFEAMHRLIGERFGYGRRNPFG